MPISIDPKVQEVITAVLNLVPGVGGGAQPPGDSPPANSPGGDGYAGGDGYVAPKTPVLAYVIGGAVALGLLYVATR